MHLFSLRAVLLVAVLSLPAVGMARPLPPAITITDAVSHALAYATDIALQRQSVEQSKGVVREEQGAFDPSMSVSTDIEGDNEPLTPYYQSVYLKSHEKKTTVTGSASIEKKTRLGITLGADLSLEREHDEILTDATDNYSTMELSITVPLLRGRGRTATADLDAARMDLEAQRLTLVNTASQSILNTASSFWEALAAKEYLRIYKETEQDASDLLHKSRLLVEKDEAPAARLDMLRADLDARTAERIRQEQSLLAARYQLALDMGLDTGALKTLADLKGAFPEVNTDLPPVQQLLGTAASSRRDLAAARMQVEYYTTLVAKYENQLLPQLDLTGSVGLKGLTEDDSESGSLDAFRENTYGPNYTVGIGVTYPFGNNAAEGLLQQHRALLERERISLASTERNVASEVLVQRNEFLSSALQLKQQADAVKRYKTSLEKEQIGFVHGMITINELIDLRDTYRDSRLTLVAMQQAYAEALAELWHVCGILVRAQGDRLVLAPDAFLAPPASLTHMSTQSPVHKVNTGDGHE